MECLGTAGVDSESGEVVVGGADDDGLFTISSSVELFPRPSSDSCFIPDLPQQRRGHSKGCGLSRPDQGPDVRIQRLPCHACRPSAQQPLRTGQHFKFKQWWLGQLTGTFDRLKPRLSQLPQ